MSAGVYLIMFYYGGHRAHHDDITADCISSAFQRKLVISQEIKEIIERREAPPEVMQTRMRMARIPEGATLIENPTVAARISSRKCVCASRSSSVMQAMLSTITKERLGGSDSFTDIGRVFE